MRSVLFASMLWGLAAGAGGEEPVDVWIDDPEPASGVSRSDSAAEAPVTGQALQALVAPIALYPDDLIAIVLPAATWPDQVYEAGSFLTEHEDDDSEATPPEHWDESVVALLNYPEVVKLMNDDPEWTRRLGNMVLYDEQVVLEAVAEFREVAYVVGNLESDERQVVERDEGVIRIRPADPAVIYVPVYEPYEVIRHRTAPVRYYPEPYAVYYYPYPVGYRLPRSHFWGVTNAYQIRWSTWDLAVHPHWYRDHPFYRQPYWPDRYYYYRFGHDHYRDWPWYTDRYAPITRPYPYEYFGWRHRGRGAPLPRPRHDDPDEDRDDDRGRDHPARDPVRGPGRPGRDRGRGGDEPVVVANPAPLVAPDPARTEPGPVRADERRDARPPSVRVDRNADRNADRDALRARVRPSEADPSQAQRPTVPDRPAVNGRPVEVRAPLVVPRVDAQAAPGARGVPLARSVPLARPEPPVRPESPARLSEGQAVRRGAPDVMHRAEAAASVRAPRIETRRAEPPAPAATPRIQAPEAIRQQAPSAPSAPRVDVPRAESPRFQAPPVGARRAMGESR